MKNSRRLLAYGIAFFLAALLLVGSFFVFYTGYIPVLNVAVSDNLPPPPLETKPRNIFDETWVIAADTDYSPYSFINKQGQPTGFDVELLYHAANELGINVDLRLVSWPVAQQLLQQGQCDVLMGLEQNSSTLPDAILTYPLQNDYFVAFGKKKFQNNLSLKGKKLAALVGSGSIDLFLEVLGLTPTTTFYETYSEAFDSVVKGENEYVISRHSVGLRQAAQFSSQDIVVAGPPLSNHYFGMGLKGDDHEKLERLNLAILKLSQDGTLDRLHTKWLKQYAEVPVLGEFLQRNIAAIIALAACLCVIALLIYVQVSRRFIHTVEVQRDNLARMLEHQQLMAEATRGLYANIFEWDISHNKAANETTRNYFVSLGLSPDTSYEDGLLAIAELKIDPEFTEGYINTFSRESVIEACAWGMNSLQYDFLIKPDDSGHFWMRITARLFRLESDDSVRMLTFRQYIDDEKEREATLIDKSQRDPMTELFNKQATGEIIDSIVRQPLEDGRLHALFIMDMDRFKQVNDTYGHAFGDLVILEFSKKLQMQFRGTDVVGRVGGDEFVVLMCNIPSGDWIKTQAGHVVQALRFSVFHEEAEAHMTASVGIAICPDSGTTFDTLYRKADQALYVTKQSGRDGYTLYSEEDMTGENNP